MREHLSRSHHRVNVRGTRTEQDLRRRRLHVPRYTRKETEARRSTAGFITHLRIPEWIVAEGGEHLAHGAQPADPSDRRTPCTPAECASSDVHLCAVPRHARRPPFQRFHAVGRRHQLKPSHVHLACGLGAAPNSPIIARRPRQVDCHGSQPASKSACRLAFSAWRWCHARCACVRGVASTCALQRPPVNFDSSAAATAAITGTSQA